MAMVTPKGFRDVGSDEARRRELIIDSAKEVFRKYGYAPLYQPALEFLSVLKAKSGEEIAGQIFKIEDEEIGLRFDLTVSLARYAANTSLPKPFKRYFIAPVWRKEEPQKGRYREFWQADVDIVGSKSMRADAEVITVANEVLKELGLLPEIVLNNRKLLDSICKKLEIEKKNELFRALDKMDKIGKEEVYRITEGLIGKKKEKELFDLLSVEGTNEEKLEILEKVAPEAVCELREIISLCEFDVTVDPFLVRGLAYYTGPVFEMKIGKEIGSVAAGGRYDDLLKLYGQGDYVTGISLGVDRIAYFLKKKTDGTKVFVCSLEGFYKDSLEIATMLREKGICCEVDVVGRSLKKQLEYASAIAVPFVVFIGGKEKRIKKVKIRNMKTGEERLCDIDEVISVLSTL